jgi:hypothetical protein
VFSLSLKYDRTQDGDSCCFWRFFVNFFHPKFWAFYCIFVHAHHSELMKSMGFMAASQMLLMMEVMVWYVVSGTHNAMSTLILVVLVLIFLELTQ